MKPGLCKVVLRAAAYRFDDHKATSCVYTEKDDIVFVVASTRHSWSRGGWHRFKRQRNDDDRGGYDGYVKAIYDGRLLYVAAWTLEEL